jgi:excisionase family DNA binding protein
MSGLAFILPPDLVDEIVQRVADELERRQTSGQRHVPSTGTRWLTVDQAAAYIGSSRQRVYDLRSAGKLSRHGDGRRALIDRNELDRLIQEGTR